jgi:hypothetical protein
MRYWDSSALVPLLVAQAATAQMQGIADDDSAAVTWWGSHIECVSALARLEREGALTTAACGEAVARLRTIATGWTEVNASTQVREHAMRLLRVHPLRAVDAIQLAAAIAAADQQPRALDFVTLDARQAEAAEKEGFSVLPPASQ